VSGNMEFSEFEIEALRELIELAVEMKKSGLLGMLKSAIADSEEAFHALTADPSLFRLAALAGALLEASRRIDGSQVALMKRNVETASYCLLDSMASTDPAKAEPKGMMGAMSALRDPDVQKGLGFLLALAKNLGACLNRAGGQG